MLYRVVREAMMPRSIRGDERALYKALRSRGVRRRTAVRLQNLYSLEEYTSWRIDGYMGEGTLGIATARASDQCVREMAEDNNRSHYSTLCIIHPVGDRKRRTLCRELTALHRAMSASKPSFTLLFSRDDLHKQHIVI